MILIILEGVKPTPLNRLYTPICKGGRPSIILSAESRKTKKIIQIEILRQKQNKMLSGALVMNIDFCIAKKKKEPDIECILKQLLDLMEGFCYYDDRQIVSLCINKHTEQEEDKVILSIEELKDEEANARYSKKYSKDSKNKK